MLVEIDLYLNDLALLPGLSGHEQKVAAYMRTVFEAHGFDVNIDTLGNCIATLPGTEKDAPVVMVFAHMDSLGFMVRYIEPDGFIRIERLGGIPEKVLPSTQVAVGRRDGTYAQGVIGIKQHHVTPPEEKYVVDKYMSLFVDIGAKSKGEVLEQGIDVGSPIVYKPRYQRLLGTKRLGTAMDNRSGCAALLMLSQMLAGKPQKSTICLVGTIWEEFNLRGAMMAARTVKPDIAIGIDGGAASDTPDLAGRGSIRLGGGPVLTHYNFHGRGTLNGTIPHPGMVRLMEEAAQKANITFQRNALVGGLTDASYLQLEQAGVKCVDIGAARRYTHGPCEVADIADTQKLCQWVFAALNTDFTCFDFSR